MPSGSWLGSLRKKKPVLPPGEPLAPVETDKKNAHDEPAAAAAVAMPAEAEAVAGSGVAAPTSGFLDGGAERYRSLLREREMKAQLRAAGLVEDGGDGTVSASSSAPATAAVQPAVAVKGQKIQSVQASKVRARRLMKELRDVKKCASVTTERVFDVDLHDENLFEWDVWLKKWDPESKIAGDLAGLAGAHGVSDVWIRLSFPDNFPFSPPFLRVLAPNIQGGFVLSGGAICMELLTPDGWSSAYTVEAIIHQTMSMMVKGEARVVTRASRPFTESEARRSYDYLVKTHKKHGWFTPAMKDG
eukprot:m.16885 g.16885  ORF g.16885 m.16885 type:complete len:302 (+) comp9135_c0_seq1:277-1182(+)